MLTGGLLGQATLIVDAANGPGAHYTDLPPAVAAAAPGDLILVRAGSYSSFALTKSLNIVGAGQASTWIQFGGPSYQVLSIQQIPANGRVAFANLTIASLTLMAPTSLSVSNCQGAIVFDGVRVVGSTGITSSGNVHARAMACNGPVVASSSSIAFDRCSMQGASGASSSAGLSCTSSNVVLSRCTVSGAPAYFSSPPTPAISLNNSTLMLTSDGGGTIGAGTGGTQSAITGTGVVDIDPNVVLQPSGGAPAAAPAVAVNQRSIPSLAVDGGPPGGFVDVDLHAPPGEAWALFVGYSYPHYSVPQLLGDAWVVPTMLWSTGVFGGSGRYVAQARLPSSSLLVGWSFSWQGFTYGPATGLAACNPVSYVHGQ